jgi:hypothetical protein
MPSRTLTNEEEAIPGEDTSEVDCIETVQTER